MLRISYCSLISAVIANQLLATIILSRLLACLLSAFLTPSRSVFFLTYRRLDSTGMECRCRRFPLATIMAAVPQSHIEVFSHSVLRSSIDALRGFGLTICVLHLDFCRFPRLTVCITPQMRPGDTSFPVVQASWALSSA